MATLVFWAALAVMAVAIVGLMMVLSAEQRTHRASNSGPTEQRAGNADGVEKLGD